MQFLISVIDDGQALAAGSNYSASPEEEAAIDTFNSRMQEEGSWVFAGGLGTPDSARVVDNRGETPLFSDGPFVESKEFLAGFWIVDVADADAALALAADGSKACNRRLEVRAFH